MPKAKDWWIFSYSLYLLKGTYKFTHFCTEDTILAVPKIFCGVCLEYFDRGAKACSLFCPPDALCWLCSTWNILRTLNVRRC